MFVREAVSKNLHSNISYVLFDFEMLSCFKTQPLIRKFPYILTMFGILLRVLAKVIPGVITPGITLVLACFIICFCLHVLFHHFEQKSPSSSMGEDSFGLVANDAATDDSTEAKITAEAVNPGVILKSKSASEVISRSTESLDEYGGGGGLRSTNRTSFKAARQHVKVGGRARADCMLFIHHPRFLISFIILAKEESTEVEIHLHIIKSADSIAHPTLKHVLNLFSMIVMRDSFAWHPNLIYRVYTKTRVFALVCNIPV